MSVFTIQEHILDASHIREYPRATRNSQDEKLRLHVKQYFPKDNPKPQKGDVTIVGAHANGFPKELYEPLWEDFYHEAKKRNVRIRSIIIADAAWQGQSGILNEASLGNDPGWLDYARDIMHILNTLRPPPPLLAMGHSFGANALTNVALMNPRLFTSVVLLDPVISRFAATTGALRNGPAAMSIRRRDTWPSRAAARAAFSRSPFYAAWDSRVLDRWVDFGLRDLPTPVEGQGPGHVSKDVTLSTSKDQEVFTFLRPSWPAYDEDPKGAHLARPDLVPDLDPALNPHWPTYPFYRPEGATTLSRLPNLRPPVLYVFGSASDLSPPELIAEKLEITGAGVGGSGGAAKGRVKSVIAEGRGHLIPMEIPGFCAKAAAEWAEEEMRRWWAEEKEYEAWTKSSTKEKTTISEEYKQRMGTPDKKNGTKEKAKI